MNLTLTDTQTDVIEISNEQVVNFIAPCVLFESSVSIEDSTIKTLSIYASYFLQGLTLKNCIIESKVNWRSGGHNQEPVKFLNCKFSDFVDFEDCWFISDLVIRDCSFDKGTNLLGNKETPVAVTFEGNVDIENTSGSLAINSYIERTGQGRLEEATSHQEERYLEELANLQSKEDTDANKAVILALKQRLKKLQNTS